MFAMFSSLSLFKMKAIEIRISHVDLHGRANMCIRQKMNYMYTSITCAVAILHCRLSAAYHRGTCLPHADVMCEIVYMYMTALIVIPPILKVFPLNGEESTCTLTIP